MKKYLAFILAIVMFCLLAACSYPGDMSDTGETQNGGAGITGYDEELDVEPEGEWYQNEFTKQIPEVDGEIKNVTMTNNFCIVSVEMNETAGKEYIAQIKNTGKWNKNISQDTVSAYVAQNEKGYEINLNYVVDQNNLTIKITKK